MDPKPYIIDFDAEVGLLSINYQGNLSIKDIIASFNEAKQNLPLPKDLLILSDFRGTETEVKYLELPKLIGPTLEAIKGHTSINNAIIADDPKTMAFSTLFRTLVKKSIINYKIFSTSEAAKRWLSNSKN